MDKQTESRKAFEVKMKEGMLFTDEELAWQPDRNCYATYGVHLAWWAWQKSRESLVVELPTEHELHQVSCSECAGNCLELVENRIRAIGIRIKGEGV